MCEEVEKFTPEWRNYSLWSEREFEIELLRIWTGVHGNGAEFVEIIYVPAFQISIYQQM